jgi:hypothetical protein
MMSYMRQTMLSVIFSVYSSRSLIVSRSIDRAKHLVWLDQERFTCSNVKSVCCTTAVCRLQKQPSAGGVLIVQRIVGFSALTFKNRASYI